MVLSRPIMTLAGSLILVLVSVSCSSKANTRTTADPPPQDSAIASDRTVYPEDRLAADRMSAPDRTASTERSVPTNRTGSVDNRMASDRVVPCADERGDATAPLDCAPRNRRTGDDRMGSDRTAYDSSTAAMANCTYRTDAKGNVIYDDPACPARYRQARQGSSYENVDVTQESAFFDRYIEKAVKHAREAEIAGNQGHAPEMLQHAQLSLDQAKEAQRAGNVPGLNEGIIALRETLSMPQSASLQDATAHVRDARIRLSQAGKMRPSDTRTGAITASATRSIAGTRTVKGELIGDETFSRSGGNNHYLLRDRSGHDIPISLTQDMTRNVQAGDMVEAQVDSEGRVLAISKYQ